PGGDGGPGADPRGDGREELRDPGARGAGVLRVMRARRGPPAVPAAGPGDAERGVPGQRDGGSSLAANVRRPPPGRASRRVQADRRGHGGPGGPGGGGPRAAGHRQLQGHLVTVLRRSGRAGLGVLVLWFLPAAAVGAVYLRLYVAKRFAFPVGYDTPKYLWRSSLVGAKG